MEKRLSKLEQKLGGNEPAFGPIQWIDARDWPLADQDALRHGDAEARAAVVEQHCGPQAPRPTGTQGPIRTVIDLPRAEQAQVLAGA